jgi:hypothetical protein
MSQTEFKNGAISPMKPKNTPSSPNEPTTIAPSVNGWNAQYIESMYMAWQEDENTLTKEWQDFFKGFELGNSHTGRPTTS